MNNSFNYLTESSSESETESSSESESSDSDTEEELQYLIESIEEVLSGNRRNKQIVLTNEKELIDEALQQKKYPVVLFLLHRVNINGPMTKRLLDTVQGLLRKDPGNRYLIEISNVLRTAGRNNWTSNLVNKIR